MPVEVLRGHAVPAQRVLASEIEDGLTGFDTDILIGVSQSGRSSETLAAFRASGAVRTAAVLNVTPSPLADLAVDLGNEPESYASTSGSPRPSPPSTSSPGRSRAAPTTRGTTSPAGRTPYGTSRPGTRSGRGPRTEVAPGAAAGERRRPGALLILSVGAGRGWFGGAPGPGRPAAEPWAPV
ncbi:hypothetical protein [Streptomyces sp. NPDC006552]|uniref:hypothetical protein n=1 Tax=Streptomyces sp. NPDC006552 TaxID=3157179 RepID=UPI0033BB1B4A